MDSETEKKFKMILDTAVEKFGDSFFVERRGEFETFTEAMCEYGNLSHESFLAWLDTLLHALFEERGIGVRTP